MLALLAPLAALALPGGLSAQPYQGSGVYYQEGLEARVWLDRGAEPVLERGERVRLYYRTSYDAFVSIFHIDTNGSVRMVFPRSPDENHFVRGGRDYRLLFPRSPYWDVGDDPGVGYFFIVASPDPFDFASFGYSHFDRGWDLSFVGRQVYGDPYVAMDEYVAALVPDWEYAVYGLDFVTYHVSARYEYPRFLCYDCHGFRPYYAWDPYHYACSSFRVVIYDDPYYYPTTRYRGTRVVYARPPRPLEPRYAFKERADGEVATPLVRPRAASAEPLTSVPRRSGAGIGSGGASPPARVTPGGGSGTRAAPAPRRPSGAAGDPVAPSTGVPAERRAPGAAAPRVERTAPPAAAPRAEPPARRDNPDAEPERPRPVLQRRPSAPASGTQGPDEPAPTRPTEQAPSQQFAPRRQPTTTGPTRSPALQGAVPLVEAGREPPRATPLFEARERPHAVTAPSPSPEREASAPRRAETPSASTPVRPAPARTAPTPAPTVEQGGGRRTGEGALPVVERGRGYGGATGAARPAAAGATSAGTGVRSVAGARPSRGTPVVSGRGGEVKAPSDGSAPAERTAPSDAEAGSRDEPRAPAGGVTRAPSADGGSRPVRRGLPTR